MLIAVAGLLAYAVSASAPARAETGPVSITGQKADRRTLRRLMAKRGFKRPPKFRAVVVRLAIVRNRRIADQKVFDYGGDGDDWQGWNAASTIKLYSAIGALERLHVNGFTRKATVEFEGIGLAKGKRFSAEDLLRQAVIKSDNHAHNLLVLLAGYDRLNGGLLSSKRGMKGSAIHKPYASKSWIARGGGKHLRSSPRIVVRQGKRKLTLKAATGSKSKTCPYHAACTSLLDLAESMRRLILHVELKGSGQQHKLGTDVRGMADWEWLVDEAFGGKKKRGNSVRAALARAWSKAPSKRRGRAKDLHLFNKPGFAGDWRSDVVYVLDGGSRLGGRQTRRWLIAMAANPGRDSLDEAARVIGEILAAGELEPSK